MKTNTGNTERVVRVVAGAILVALAATNAIGWWGWLGLVPLATGLLGWCPLYTLLGINTCRPKKAPEA